MDLIKWGIIGCGDVAERKSGPAFNKVEGSELIAVMRRDAEKAKDFATRHKVPHWYSDAGHLLNNPEINAVYVATPPNTHLEYALKALAAGKNVYLEKPVALSSAEAREIKQALIHTQAKLSVAHYRRFLPAFVKVKELLGGGAIGEVRLADIQILQPLKSEVIAQSEQSWRTNPAISGGGYFHDLAPHQLDLMLYYFGALDKFQGFAVNQSGAYEAHDNVNGLLLFKNGVQVHGSWCFNVATNATKDRCTLYGSKGVISFSFFGDSVTLELPEESHTFSFANPEYVQYPMIAETVAYFLGKRDNPCSIDAGIDVMDIIDAYTR